MCHALALGADRDFRSRSTGLSVIHQSILSGSVMACAYLLLNGARVGAVDAAGAGDTPLHLAARGGGTGQVRLLFLFEFENSVTRRFFFKSPIRIAAQTIRGQGGGIPIG